MPRLFLRIFASYWLALLATVLASELLFPRPTDTNASLAWAVGLRLFAAIIISTAVCLFATYHTTRPVIAIRLAARSLALGNLTARARTSSSHRDAAKHDEVEGLAQDFNHMAARLESLVESQKRLVRDVSHELRSPLTRLSLSLDLLRQSPDDAPELLARMNQEIERVNTIIGRLLTLLRLEGESELSTREWFDLEDLVAQVIDDVRLEANAKHCAIKNPAPQSYPVCGDFELLRSALENVVRNAIRHTAPNSEVTVQLGCEDPGRFAFITVEDHGPGIPEAELVKIFQPFYRIDPSRSRSTGGFGLGLTIAQRAVQLHGGTIQMANRENHSGLRVQIRIPTGTEPHSQSQGSPS